MMTFSNTLSVEEYNGLRRCVDWNEIEPEQAAAGLANSDFLVVARDADTAVGMARAFTDHGYFVFIVDVIVHPNYQGQHLGTKLMNAVLDHYRQTLRPGQKRSVNLMAISGKEEFYEKLGFTRRPNADSGHGMTCYLYPKGQ